VPPWHLEAHALQVSLDVSPDDRQLRCVLGFNARAFL
jgi:hypothetical protein